MVVYPPLPLPSVSEGPSEPCFGFTPSEGDQLGHRYRCAPHWGFVGDRGNSAVNQMINRTLEIVFTSPLTET